LVNGAFDCAEDGPRLSGNDSPPKDKINREKIPHLKL